MYGLVRIAQSGSPRPRPLAGVLAIPNRPGFVAVDVPFGVAPTRRGVGFPSARYGLTAQHASAYVPQAPKYCASPTDESGAPAQS
jgi:hypothetical protein